MPHGSGSATPLGVATGLYGFRVVADPANGYELGQTYMVLLSWATGDGTYSQIQRFTVT
jgi:hypothetical protein